tara:strand:- start:129632 stop:130543 length:912 start_codon:yes stop_codon:yes gene_type:complete
MKRLFLLFIVSAIFTLVLVQEANAQRWNRYRKEIGFTVGASNMLSDLGGGPGVGSRYGDFQFGTTRYAVGGYFKYRIHDHFAVKLNLLYAQLYGDDQLTDNYSRRSRNLDVRTGLLELSGQVEFYIIRERIGSRYKLKGVRGYGSNNFSLYVFAGIGGAYYNPKGTNTNGDWVSLAPLNTEGQGLAGAPKDYSQFTFVFPSGVGLKYNISKIMGVQFEASTRFTTTDYLDDASTQYYDGNALAANFGAESKAMADKRYNSVNRHQAGGTRGHDDKTDMYMFGLLTVTMRIRSRARSRVRTEKF